MKLLVFSHPCVVALNQSFYADVSNETGWTVDLVVPEVWQSEYTRIASTERWKDFRGKIHRVGVFLPGDIPRHVYKSWIIPLLKEENPDAIFVHHEPYGFATFQIYAANRLAGRVPIGFYAAQNIQKTYPPPISQAERWVFRESSFAFPVTRSALQVLRSKGYRNRAEVLPLAVNTELYRANPEWSEQQRQTMGIQPGRVVIGYLGRLVEEKGLDKVLSALLPLQSLPWSLVFVGSGPMEQALRDRVNSDPQLAERVHFVGYVPHTEAPNWLSFFDVLVLASETRGNWKEQFGRVLIEAMACGTPVVGSNSGEIPNIIESTGGGLVFPEGDVGQLSSALETMVTNPTLRGSLGRTGSEAVKRDYAQTHLARRFVTEIEESMRERAAH